MIRKPWPTIIYWVFRISFIIDMKLPEFGIRCLPIQISNILELLVSQIIFTIKKYSLF